MSLQTLNSLVDLERILREAGDSRLVVIESVYQFDCLKHRKLTIIGMSIAFMPFGAAPYVLAQSDDVICQCLSPLLHRHSAKSLLLCAASLLVTSEFPSSWISYARFQVFQTLCAPSLLLQGIAPVPCH